MLKTSKETFEVDLTFIKWAQNVGIIDKEFLKLASQVEDSGDVYFVPHMQSNDGGILIGFSIGTSRANLAKAIVQAVCF